MNTALDEIQPSATLALAAKARALRAEGKDVLSFTAGEPDFDTPDHIKQAAKDAVDAGFTKYTPVAGTPDVRKAICEKFKRENNLSYEPDETMVGVGGKQIIFNFLYAVCNRGDEVIIPSPFWLSYPEQARLAAAKPIFAETENGVARAHLIEEAITEKSKVLILNYPSNPTGATIPKDELEKIAEVVKKHDLLVLSDEVYEHFLYGAEHTSFATLSDMKERTLTLGSCSKTYSMTGWHVGFCAGPQHIIKTMTKIQSHTTSGPTSFAQSGAAVALTGTQDSVQTMKEAFTTRRELIMEGVKEAGLTFIEPDGAFYLFVNIESTGLSSMEFADQFLENELVATVPGKPFGADKYVRFSYACSDETITNGMERLKRFVNALH